MNKLNVFVLIFVFVVDYVNTLDLTVFYEYLDGNVSSSTECETQKRLFLNGLENNAEWALKSKKCELLL